MESKLLTVEELCLIKIDYVEATGVIREDIREYVWAALKAQDLKSRGVDG